MAEIVKDETDIKIEGDDILVTNTVTEKFDAREWLQRHENLKLVKAENIKRGVKIEEMLAKMDALRADVLKIKFGNMDITFHEENCECEDCKVEEIKKE